MHCQFKVIIITAPHDFLERTRLAITQVFVIPAFDQEDGLFRGHIKESQYVTKRTQTGETGACAVNNIYSRTGFNLLLQSIKFRLVKQCLITAFEQFAKQQNRVFFNVLRQIFREHFIHCPSVLVTGRDIKYLDIDFLPGQFSGQKIDDLLPVGGHIAIHTDSQCGIFFFASGMDLIEETGYNIPGTGSNRINCFFRQCRPVYRGGIFVWIRIEHEAHKTIPFN